MARLQAAAADGSLDELCRRHGVRVLTVFGSAARGEPAARDLDIGVLSEPGRRLDTLGLLAELSDLTGVAEIDLVHLNPAPPLTRERALVGCLALFESAPGRYAAAQTAAIGQRIETDPWRRLDLALLAR